MLQVHRAWDIHINNMTIKGSAKIEPSLEGSTRSSIFSSENKILFLAVVTISVAFLATAFTLSTRYQSTLDENYKRFGELTASMVAVGGSERLESALSPSLRIQSFADNMLNVNDDVAAIEFYNNNGQTIYETHKKAVEAANPNLIDFTAPLKITNEKGETENVGEVHVKLTGKSMRDMAASTRSTVLMVFFSAWLITVLAVALNTYILTKHLRTLVAGVRRLSIGDFGFRISESDLWGDLKHLAESFNDMSMRLRAYEDQNLETITVERNKLEGILLSISDGVIVCDYGGEVILLNNAACTMLGVKSSKLLIGTNIRDYLTVEGETCFAPAVDAFEALSTQHHHILPETFSRQVIMPDITLKVTISPIQDTEGGNLGFVMIMHDVTREAAVDKLKTSFISNVSHELRTPVTTIKSYVDTIFNHGEELDKETYHEFIETIHVETDRLKKLVNDILDFSRLEEGGVKLDKEWQDITPIVNLTVQSIKVLAQQKNIHVSTAIESNLPQIFMNSDSIERVLLNLLSNAIKYTPEGGRIKVRAELAERENAVEVTVTDTGIGIPDEHLPHIFDRFYRVENEVHTIKGTGLGLHLVKVAIENHHHGQVFVKSQVGVGSTFGFRLLLQPVEDEPGHESIKQETIKTVRLPERKL